MSFAAASIAPIHMFGIRIWGFATGGWYRDSSDPAELVQLAMQPLRISSKPQALEATAQTPAELKAWALWMGQSGERPRLPVIWSLHAPSKGLADLEAPFADLAHVPSWVESIIVHPDVIDMERDGQTLKALGPRLVLENMDRRKSRARTADELTPWFDVFPEAGLCIDLAHAWTIDQSGTCALEIFGRHGHRLRQIHVSQVEPNGHHLEVSSREKLAAYQPLIDEIDPDGRIPVILESKLG